MSWRQVLRRPGVWLGGLGVYAGGAALAYAAFYQPPADLVARAAALTPAQRQAIFDANAQGYDKSISLDETLMGLSLMRRYLLRQAHGQVLEVCAGTGRNLRYYPRSTEVTLVDFSPAMLKQIQVQATAPLASCALDVMPVEALTFPSRSFDTVVDTFGLCSLDNPATALQEMQRVCKADGRLLLLEHGTSRYRWMASILDRFAAAHVLRWGCHWNRDIEGMVKNAGMEIESLHRFHFGTTYLIVARPRAETAESKAKGLVEAIKSAIVHDE